MRQRDEIEDDRHQKLVDATKQMIAESTQSLLSGIREILGSQNQQLQPNSAPGSAMASYTPSYGHHGFMHHSHMQNSFGPPPMATQYTPTSRFQNGQTPAQEKSISFLEALNTAEDID